jgi:hypothetical protein
MMMLFCKTWRTLKTTDTNQCKTKEVAKKIKMTWPESVPDKAH